MTCPLCQSPEHTEPLDGSTVWYCAACDRGFTPSPPAHSLWPVERRERKDTHG